jgi:hypothetical protein
MATIIHTRNATVTSPAVSAEARKCRDLLSSEGIQDAAVGCNCPGETGINA